MIITCTHCGSKNIKSHGKTRWKCGKCGKTFRENPKRGGRPPLTPEERELRGNYLPIESQKSYRPTEPTTDDPQEWLEFKKKYKVEFILFYKYDRMIPNLVFKNLTLSEKYKDKPLIYRIDYAPPDSHREYCWEFTTDRLELIKGWLNSNASEIGKQMKRLMS